MTQKAAAEILKMAPSTLSNCLHRVITRVRSGHTIRGLVTLGAVEIAYCKGRKYVTIIYDLDCSHVVWVGRGLGRETIDRFFNESLSEHQRLKSKWASCDRGRAYTKAIQHHCPNATLVIDCFHGVKALNEALDERPLTNAVGEGINRLLKIVKIRASGFRGLEPFADLIFLTIGDLDIPARIPSDLRTL